MNKQNPELAPKLSAAVATAVFAAFPAVATAQDWATPAYCEAPPRPIQAASFAPYDMAAIEQAASAIPNSTGRFWKVETPDGTTSHLWGTFHVSSREILDLPDVVKSEIANARAVALEIDFTFPDRTSFLMQYDLPGRYRDPGDPFAGQDPLDLGFLSPEAEGWVYDRLYGYGTFDDALYVLTYGGLAELLLSDPCEDFTSGTLPVQDDFIHTLGHVAGASIIGLEEPGAFLTAMSEDEETAKAIVTVYASYLEPPTSPVERSTALQLYLEGRLGLLAAWDAAHLDRVFGADGRQALTRTNAYLLDDRNERFFEELVPELNAGGVFVAVGAAHLPGANGLVAMLRRSGYTVTRISLPGEAE
ncbi:MAG: TraB/GumN family protein [Pseudomonadota bacterium]